MKKEQITNIWIPVLTSASNLAYASIIASPLSISPNGHQTLSEALLTEFDRASSISNIMHSFESLNCLFHLFIDMFYIFGQFDLSSNEHVSYHGLFCQMDQYPLPQIYLDLFQLKVRQSG